MADVAEVQVQLETNAELDEIWVSTKDLDAGSSTDSSAKESKSKGTEEKSTEEHAAEQGTAGTQLSTDETIGALSALADSGVDTLGAVDSDEKGEELPSPFASISGRRSTRRRSLDDGMEIVVTTASMPEAGALADLAPLGPLGDIPPPGTIFRSISLDTGKQKEERKRKAMMLQDPADGGILSARQPSLEIFLSPMYGIGKRQKSEGDTPSATTIVVPARQVLLRMPIYSTPLTMESTNFAYRDFVRRLVDMGFELRQSECAVVMTKAENVERAVDFIFQNPDGLWHRFKPDESTKELLRERNERKENTEFEELFEKADLCAVCGLQYFRHYIGPDGTKVEIEEELSGDALLGELAGRLSMSQATRDERNALLASIRAMNENRLNEIERMESDIIPGAASDDEIVVDIPAISDVMPSAATIVVSVAQTQTASDTPMETCMVCFDEKPQSDFLIAECGHNYCHVCLREHYRVKTKDGDVLKVECIDPKCDREILEDEVKQCLAGDSALLRKFEKFRRDRLLMMDPNTRFCVTPDCDGFMTGNRFRPKMECPICHVHVCFNCNQGWHGYFIGCNSSVNVGLALWKLNKNVQKCPRCKVTIEKSEGCNHMTCSSCKYEFCWICRGPYSYGHFSDFNLLGCPGGQYTGRFVRFPACFPRWLNRMIIITCFFGVAVPCIGTGGFLFALCGFLALCLLFFTRLVKWDSDADMCDLCEDACDLC